jgi:hypothetical protein
MVVHSPMEPYGKSFSGCGCVGLEHVYKFMTAALLVDVSSGAEIAFFPSSASS